MQLNNIKYTISSHGSYGIESWLFKVNGHMNRREFSQLFTSQFCESVWVCDPNAKVGLSDLQHVEKITKIVTNSRWWLNQPTWKICVSQIGSFFQGWKFPKCLKPPPIELNLAPFGGGWMGCYHVVENFHAHLSFIRGTKVKSMISTYKGPLFWLERPCFRGLTFKNRGHLGSRQV